MKIAIIVYSLAHGGAERSSAILSKMLCALGYEIQIICITDAIAYSYEGKLINLDKIVHPKRGIAKRWAKIKYVKKLLQKEQFDYVIDTRSRKSWLKQFVIVMLLLRNERMIYMVHSYNLKFYFSSFVFLARFIYQKAYRFVGVSKAAILHLEETYGFKQGICIYNAYEDLRIHKLAAQPEPIPKTPYILSYGRISDYVKDYQFLIRTYKQSVLPQKEIKLYILGDGPDKRWMQDMVKQEKLDAHILFLDFTNNPFPYVKSAIFTTLTSNYEGFPMVLVESMALSTPVVAVDCKSGPSELIKTGENGILVPFKSEKKFIEALNRMVTDFDFYQKCKAGTLQSVAQFKVEKVRKKWRDILEKQ